MTAANPPRALDTKALFLSLITFVMGSSIFLGFIIAAAHIDTSQARQHVAEAFANETLVAGAYREIELVTGFIVMESDNFSTCVMLSQMLAPADTVFAEGEWGVTGGVDCASLEEAVTGGETQKTSWYRYWHGASAISKVMLAIMSVQGFQIVLTMVLVILLVALIVSVYRISAPLGTGVAFVLLGTSDLAWQGLSLVHGISSSVGLIGVLAVLTAFRRNWAARWGIVALAGFTYASTAQMLTPMAFAILSGVFAMLPLLLKPASAWSAARGLGVGVLWIVGYGAGLASRYLWVATVGPGLEQIQGELSGSAQGIYMTTSAIQPFHQLVGLVMKTWLDVGWMQVGLMMTFGVMGWLVAKGAFAGLANQQVALSLTPMLLGVGWLIIWAGHTNHTFVHVLLSAMLVNLLFSLDYARRLPSLSE